MYTVIHRQDYWEGEISKNSYSKVFLKKYLDGKCVFTQLDVNCFSPRTCGGREQKVGKSIWDMRRKTVDLEQPTPPMNQVYSGCTQRKRKTDKRIVEENRKKSNSYSQQER